MSNTYFLKTLLTLAALMGMAACGGGDDSGSTPAPPPPAAPASFSFPVVPTTPPAPQGCVREDGKQGVSAVTYIQQNPAGDFDLVVLRCDSSSGQRILLAQAGVTPELRYIDAAGTVVASRGSTLFAMLPGSTQEIELADGSGSYPADVFVGVFNDRALYKTSSLFPTQALVSVTISQTPIRTILHEHIGTMRVHNQLVDGRVFFATVDRPIPATQYRSVRPDGTDPLLLRSVPDSVPSLSDPAWVYLTLRDREVIYFERTSLQAVPTIRMLAIDTPGSDVLIAGASIISRALAVPGAPDRFVFLGFYPNTTAPILTDVNAERGNLTFRTLQLDGAIGPIGFSQGRLYIEGALPPMPNLLRGWVSWLGEGRTAPLTVLSGLWAAYDVTDRAIVYSRSPFLSNGTQFARSDLDGSNERMGSFANSTNNGVHTRAGEQIYYLVHPLSVDAHVATLDLVTGIETVVYRPNPAQDEIRFFRIGGRLIIWRPARFGDPGWIDSVDLDGNDLRRLDQSPDILDAKPF